MRYLRTKVIIIIILTLDHFFFVVTLYLESIWINLQVLDLLYRWHVLLVILFVFLLLAQLANLEHLQPAFVSKHFSAELDHLTVYCVIGWNITNKLSIFWLDIGNH